MSLRPDFLERYGPWAIVTGASSGIGAEFARQLAAQGLNLVLAARRQDRLQELAASLRAAHGAEVRILPCDLGRLESVLELDRETASLDVGLVVSNAGFGDKGRFVDSDLAAQLEMLDVNCRAALALTHRFAQRLTARRRGGIVVTSSTAAFQGLPYSSHYAATKGYLLQLAEGLAVELEPDGVDVLALCPGPTDTEGPIRTGVDATKSPVKFMQVGPVVREALEALGKRTVVIPGRANRLAYALVCIAPRRVAARIAGRMVRRVTER